jgi:hypothetical protein
MVRCDSARRELKNELRKFSDHEIKMKRFFNFSTNQERILAARKNKMEEITSYAEKLADDRP